MQRAIADLLVPKIDPTLSSACRAFRKGHSAVGAAEDVGRWIANGTPWVWRGDIRGFFDAIQPEILQQKLEPFVDAKGLRLLGRLLRCQIFDHHQISEMVVGIPQGSPLSPLLANLYLSDLDHTVNRRCPHYVRYCDDMLILGRDEAECERAHEEMVRSLEPLGLALNEEKTRICRAEDGFTFLGYHFGATGRGPAVKAVEALQFRLRQLESRESVDATEIDAIYRGWMNYFGQHPQSWRESPAGVLALLRAKSLSEPEVGQLGLPEARWQTSAPVSSALALELARAWSTRGSVEQSWLEMAAACGGSRAGTVELAEWAHVLRVEPTVLEQLAPRLVGTPSDRLVVLGEAVAEMGKFELASRLAAAGSHYVRAEEPDSGSVDMVAAADTSLLIEWFQGRDGIHAVEAVNRSGHRSFVPVHRPLRSEDWLAHLRGEKTLALAMVRMGNTAFLGVLDVDIERRALDEHLGVPDPLLGRALSMALRLRCELKRRGVSSLLEFSGYKGYHVWVRFDSPVTCFRLRLWLLDVVRSLGKPPDGIRVEEFPSRDRVKPDAVGPLIKLPLGVHSRSGRTCSLLDEKGDPLADPFGAIRSLPRAAAATVAQPERAVAAPPTVKSIVPTQEVGPKATRVLEGCRVLGYLAKRSGDTSYLNHRERLTLLCTLGHLGDEGRAALHAIIGKTYNYKREATERHVDRLPSWPMSCPKIREFHPEAAATGACSCQFELRGKGYPTPVLFALRPSEIPVFNQRIRSGRLKRTAQENSSTDTAKGSKQLREAEEKVHKIAELKRHRRGIESAIERLQGDLSRLFDEANTEVLDLAMGRLRRVKHEDTEGWHYVIEV